MTSNGTVDSTMIPESLRAAAERRSELIRKRSSPKGMLGLPKLLDERRIEYGITDSAFKFQASFDRILVWQIAMQKGDTFEEGGLIAMPDTVKAKERNKAPHGIIVSAGLLALDQLVSNGMNVGHRVLFCHSAPYFVRYDTIDGQHHHLVVLKAGDVIASEDTALGLRAQRMRIIQNPENKTQVEHFLVNEDGFPVMPQGAESDED